MPAWRRAEVIAVVVANDDVIDTAWERAADFPASVLAAVAIALLVGAVVPAIVPPVAGIGPAAIALLGLARGTEWRIGERGPGAQRGDKRGGEDGFHSSQDGCSMCAANAPMLHAVP